MAREDVIRQLKQLAQENNGERERLVSTLVKATGSARAIRVNDERNKERGTNG